MTVIISDGAQVRTLPTSLPWSNNAITTYNGPSGGNVSLWGGRSATYEQIVFSQPWVYAAIRTFYLAVARALHDRRRDRHHLRGRGGLRRVPPSRARSAGLGRREVRGRRLGAGRGPRGRVRRRAVEAAGGDELPSPSGRRTRPSFGCLLRMGWRSSDRCAHHEGHRARQLGGLQSVRGGCYRRRSSYS